MKPIPEIASVKDICWKPEFYELGRELVMERAKPKLIARLTDLSKNHLAGLYKAISPDSTPSGSVQIGKAERFVNGHGSRHRSGTSINLQATMFLLLYEQLEKLIEYRANRGWLLLTSYRAYCAMTRNLTQIDGFIHLDINQAWAVLFHAGFITSRELAEIAIHECDTCKSPRLVMINKELDTQPCPLCAIEKNHERLVSQSQELKAQKTAKFAQNLQATNHQ